MSFFDGNNEEHRQLADAYDNNTYDQLPQTQVLSHYQSFINNAPQNEIQEVHQDYFNQMPQAQRMGLFSGLMDTIQNQQGGNFDPRQAGVHTADPRQASPTDLGNLFNFALNSGMLGGLMGGGQQQPAQQGGLGGLLGGLMGGGQQQQPQQGGLGGLLGGLMGGGQQQHSQNQQQPGYGGNSGGLQGLLSNPLAQAALSGLISYAASRAINGFANRRQAQPQPQQQPDYNQPDNSGYNNDYQSGNNSRTYSQQQPSSGNYDLGGGGSALPGFENNQKSS